VNHGALAGVRVIDFSRFQQGPYATRLLSDLGADIVKIERPGGDWDRELRATADGFSGFFYGLNCGKKSVAVDIRSAAGREVVLRLVRDADVVVENFRPGVMDRLGLGYQDLSSLNSSLIYAAASGWGPAGPNSAEPMYDMVGQAVAGVSDFNRSPDGRPRLATRGYADAGGGVFLAMGIVTALYARARTGQGQRVDASLVGACIGLHTQEITVSLNQGEISRPQGRVTPASGAFRCRDGDWLVIAATDQKLWEPLCRALERPALAADTRFATRILRLQARDVLEPQLEEAFLQRDRDAWLPIMKAHGIPVGAVRTFLELAHDEDVRSNGYITEIQDPVWGSRLTAGPPFHLSRTPAAVAGRAPDLGESTDEELSSVGYSTAEIEALVASGVVQRAT
jgi:CoA:oxalate CoA-transferase